MGSVALQRGRVGRPRRPPDPGRDDHVDDQGHRDDGNPERDRVQVAAPDQPPDLPPTVPWCPDTKPILSYRVLADIDSRITRSGCNIVQVVQKSYTTVSMDACGLTTPTPGGTAPTLNDCYQKEIERHSALAGARQGLRIPQDVWRRQVARFKIFEKLPTQEPAAR